MRGKTTRVPLVLLLLLLGPSAGCLDIPAASVPTTSLEAKGWRENSTAARSDSEWGGLGRTELRVFEHPRGSTGYGGTLSIATIRAWFEPSEEDLRDQLQTRVEAQSESKGIAIGTESQRGERKNDEGRGTVWFTAKGTATSADTVFTRNAEVRIVGEVWNCREARTVVVAVGLAQTNDVRTIGGIEVQQNPDYRTWSALVADASGSIDGRTGAGLLHAIVC